MYADAEGEGERKPLWLYGGLVCVRCETSTQDRREAHMHAWIDGCACMHTTSRHHKCAACMSRSSLLAH